MKNLMQTTTRLFILTCALCLNACSNEPQNTTTAADEQLAAAQREKDSIENLFLVTLDDIDNSIDWVFKERTDASKEGGNKKSIAARKQEILKNIELASTMLRDNKARIDELEAKAGKSSTQNARLTKRLAESSERIKKYEAQLATLYDLIADKDWEIDNLKHNATKLELENIMQKGFADKFEDDLHTAYYVKGTSKQLKESGVIVKEGGILGLGRTGKLKQNFSDKQFEKIDTRKTTSIPVNAKKVKLITTHPSGSYEWKEANGQVASLEIRNADEFWKTSKHITHNI